MSDAEARGARRNLFGRAIAAYDAGRPPYPDSVYSALESVCSLGPGSAVLEIGPGNGLATMALLDLGATVTAVELSAPFCATLRDRFVGRPLTVVEGAFESVTLPNDDDGFDAVVAATSFHWVPPEDGLLRCHKLLRAGGHLALWWNVFGDPTRPDPFHDALVPLLRRHAPTALDEDLRNDRAPPPPVSHQRLSLTFLARAEPLLTQSGFTVVHNEVIRWTGRHTADQARALFGSFSNWLALDHATRETALDALHDLIGSQFDGVIERPYQTPLVIAQRD